eukprot:3328676-Alexandrium_andersonii.AAC.1
MGAPNRQSGVADPTLPERRLRASSVPSEVEEAWLRLLQRAGRSPGVLLPGSDGGRSHQASGQAE